MVERVTLEKTNLKGVYLLKPGIFTDNRGSYCELYNKKEYSNLLKENNLDYLEFLTDCISISKKNVLKGFHGDLKTWKLTTCLEGEVYSVILNCDESSKDFGRWESFILSEKNRHQLLIPPKFGNSFLVLSDKAIYYYKQSTYYNPKELPQFTFKWNDPRFDVKWPIDDPILSERDK